ncbi:CHC2 zinc finger domain-containing protein [Microcoleus sp. MON2_D5]|uniref:CHC2 zinc finger domain-containing protein n=1 Tax=Microcoleus sp. MON2_D5 TaxID=2818833 RepID=UPI002FCF9446
MSSNSNSLSGQTSSVRSEFIYAINKFPQEWALTPCVGKKNLWSGWQKNKLDRARLIEAIQSQTNAEGKKTLWTGVSVVTGPLSDGVMAIDFDGPLAWKKYLELSGDQEPPLTKRWTSGKAGHFQILLSVPPEKWGGLKPQKIELDNNEKLELRWNQCSTLPPSIHPDTGKPYFWESEAPIAECPDFILDLMREMPMIEAIQKAKPETTAFVSADEKSLVEILEKDILPLLDAEEFYGSHLKLKPAGKNLKALCPFHSEKSPSFTISPIKKTFHCFGCAVGGGPVQFLHQLRGGLGSPTGKDFAAIVQELADSVGLRMPDRKKNTLSNNSSISHPRTQENVVYLSSLSSDEDYNPDGEPNAAPNFCQIAESKLYSEGHWKSIGGQLYKFVGSHYELRPEVEEKRRIGDWLNKYAERTKSGAWVHNRAKASYAGEVFAWVVGRKAIDPNKINPDGLNCSNGVLKVNSDGSYALLPHDPEKVYTYVGCKFDPAIDPADCDRLLECLEPSQREIFLRTAAAALNLKIVRSKLTGRGVKGLLCHGEGSNGKDTLRAVLAAVYGNGMTGKSLSDFRSYDTGRKFTLAAIEGSICNWASENTGKIDLDSIQSLKQFITGDPLDIERKGKDSYEYKAGAIFLANCNKLPSITGGTEAIEGRYGILRFDKTYAKNAIAAEGQLEADPRFKDDEKFILEQIAPAMLNKMLERWPLLLSEGIDYKATKEAMQKAQEESRHLWQFVRDAGIEVQTGGRVYIKDLWERLQEWYVETGTLEIEPGTNDRKDKLIWHDLPNKYDTPVKAINQVFARFSEIFPKLKKLQYNGRDEMERRAQWYLSGISFVQNPDLTTNFALPALPVDTEQVTALPTALPSDIGRASGEATTLAETTGRDGRAVLPTILELCNTITQLTLPERQKLVELLTGTPCSDPLKAFRIGDKVAGNNPEESSYNWHGRIVEIHTSISCKVDWQEREGKKGGRVISMLFCNLRKI